jgi:Tannase-like family of unknown function (DUF6351)
VSTRRLIAVCMTIVALVATAATGAMAASRATGAGRDAHASHGRTGGRTHRQAASSRRHRTSRRRRHRTSKRRSAHAGLPKPVIYVLSSRADLISGGEALVSVSLPSGTNPSGVEMLLGGQDVTSQFAMRDNGQYEGLLTGLAVGSNTLTAALPDGARASRTIIDHANGGPLFAGPQMQPWLCENGSSDPQCNAPATYAYQYKSVVTGLLLSYNPSSPPPAAAIASTTTQNGVTVPFIIRSETGYEDRDQYQITVLYQPGKPWTAWDPQPQFVHKLLITHGASCGADHESATAPSTTSDTVGVPGGPGVTSSPTTALGMGYAVMSTALDNAGHNCNVVTEAESLVMAKQHLIDDYGTLEFTIGTGCSGGSLAQQQVANAYPGIYQGILPQCSFPDAWSTGQQLLDYQLTRNYFENPTKWGTGIAWTPAQIAAIQGNPNYANSVELSTLYWPTLANPAYACAGVTAAQRWSTTNPTGTRCDLEDDMINVFGPYEGNNPYHYAGIPLDNVGVEYGLDALQQGLITPAQFVDINQKIGGYDNNYDTTSSRMVAEQPALANDYRSGAIDETNNLTDVAIIDLRGPDAGSFHDAYRSWAIRARLEQQEGHFPMNDVIWFGETPLIGDVDYTTEGFLAMDQWLSAVATDHRDISLEDKIAEDRPASVHDECSDIPDLDEVNLPGVGEVCELPLAQTKFATPRMEAGESIATDIEKCQLEPLTQSSFYPTTFTDADWATLEQTFPNGVCDWTKPGVDQQNTIPWLTYQSDAAGNQVVYGGKPLGPAPADSGEGWTDPSFDSWLDPTG